MISVIIPAYNEAKVISRCLTALIDVNQVYSLDIIVVCNGCEDLTAEKAIQTMPEANVISTNIASKTKAINLGLENCKYETVLLMDADIVFSLENLVKLVIFSKNNSYLVTSPRVLINLTRANLFVKGYYKVSQQLPYLNKYKISHVILLTKKGKERVGPLPDVIADDNYVRIQFKEIEGAVLDDIHYVLTPPATYWGLIKILSRSHLGNLQLKALYPELVAEGSPGHSISLIKLFKQIKLYPSLVTFLITKLIAKIRAQLQFVRMDNYKWEKDESSRDV